MVRSKLPAASAGRPRGRAGARGAQGSPLARALTALGFLALFVVVLTTVLEGGATNAALLGKLQQENGVLEDAGVTLEELEKIDAQLAAYLAGDAEALAGAPFNEREVEHMEDVFALFSRLRAVRTALAVAAAVLLIAGLWLSRGRGALASSLWALALLASPLLALGIWAAVDFTSAFNVFHRALFDNELWRLNPETDLLIRLCPESFFRDIAALLALRAGLFIGAVPLALYGVRFGRRFYDAQG